MDRKELLDYGYRIRDGKLWKRMSEMQLFAVSLKNGIGYCMVMGELGEHRAVSCNYGAEGYRGIYTMNHGNGHDLRQLLVQCGVQVHIVTRSELDREEKEELMAYCEQTGRAFRGPYPRFLSMRPYQMVTPNLTPEDEEAIAVVMQVADALAKGELMPPESIDEVLMDDRLLKFGMNIPLFTLKDGSITVGSVEIGLPEPEPVPPGPELINDLAVARMRRQRQKGTFQCEIIRFGELMPGSDGNPSFLPAGILTVEESGELLRPVIMEKHDYTPEDMMEAWFSSLGERYPETIRVCTEATRVFLEEFCRRAGIRLVMEKRLPLMEDVKQQMDMMWDEDYGMPDVGEDEMQEMMIQAIVTMDEETLASLPLWVLEDAAKLEDMPPETAKRIRRILGKKKE